MRNHFVPRFLLTAWTIGNVDKKLVEFRLDLAGVPTARRVPKATGYMDDLLTLSEPFVDGMPQDAIETQLMQRVDSDAAILRVKMLEGASLAAAERCDWVRFLNSLRLRQPKFVTEKAIPIGTASALEVLNRAPEEYKALAQPDDPNTLIEFVRVSRPGLIENFGLKAYPRVIDNPLIGEMLINMTWSVCDVSSANYDLVLGDNPLISVGNLEAAKFVLALPLSPTKLFVACRAAATVHTFAGAKPNELVARMNESSVERASRWVYARTEDPGRFIRNRVKTLLRFRNTA